MSDTPQSSQLTLLGETNFRNQRRRFGIKKDDRRRHTYLIGKTGMGKSTVMENMIIQDIINGEGVALVDPHGDFAEKILDYIPARRINDVIYFNPADGEYPIAFNVMESVDQGHKHLIASGLVGVFKKLFAESWGPRLEYVLRNAILALLDYPGSTLLGVMRILVDKAYREKVINKIQDPVVRSFWVEEYSKYPQQFQTEAIAPIQNKVGQFLSTALIRNILGQVTSTIDLREIMDTRKILIMNFSKGRIGEDASALLGAMMITKIQLAAMSRIDIEEEKRQDFYLYVDEFQNFATDSFATILSEARKYRLDLIIGHQYIEQLEEQVQAAVFGNVGTIMCFRIGAGDAEFLAQEFAPYFTEEDLVNLAKYNTYLKLMIDGVASNPFSATTLPPLGPTEQTSSRDKIIAVSRERYAKPRAVVEDKINRWSGMTTDDDPPEDSENNSRNRPRPPRAETNRPERAPALRDKEREPRPNFDSKRREPRPEPNGDRKDKTTYRVNCYECGKPTEVTFKPDGVRPIYCSNCYHDIRERMTGTRPKEVVAEEVPAKNQPEISLADALKQSPVTFKNTIQAQPAAAVAPPQQPPMTSTPRPQPKKVAAQPRQATNNEAVEPSPTAPPRQELFRTLKPGEIVKL